MKNVFETTRGTLPFVLITASLFGLTGCHAQPPKTAPEPCEGERVGVRVRNGSSNAVDVYMYLGEDQVGKILGTASPGVNEFRLPTNFKFNPLRFQSRRPNGTPIVPAFGNRAEYSRVTYEVQCSA